MSDELNQLLQNNRAWAQNIERENPGFFSRLARQQKPQYLWIGCSDSRVPANEIVGLMPGEVFVHRNVANLVVHTDLNCLSVMQFAIDVLQVRDILIVGHYGCGGVRASLANDAHGLIDNWLRHVKDLVTTHGDLIAGFGEGEEREDRLCELNVACQVSNAACTTVVQSAWARGQPLAVHGCIYSLRDGLLRNLNCSVSSPGDLPDIYRLGRPLPAH